LIVANTSFGELYEFSGGQCLDCPPPDSPAHSSAVGRVAMLFDAPHRVQVGFNGEPFMTFHALNFGYGSVEPGDGGDGLVDLSGKWAVSWHHPPYDLPGGSVPPGEPLVFEIWRLAPEDGAAGNPSYVAVDLAGREMAQISCDFAATANACVWHKAPGFWESAYWDYGDGDDIPLAILSHRRIGYVPVGEEAVVKAEAVRID
jgi:hypothetical protein